MLHHKANLNGYLAYETGQSLERINQDTDRDFFMSAKEAKEYGLIDGVIMNPLKTLQPLPASTSEEANWRTLPSNFLFRISHMVFPFGFWYIPACVEEIELPQIM